MFHSDGLEIDSPVGPLHPNQLHSNRGSEFGKRPFIGAFSEKYGSFYPVRYPDVIGELRRAHDDRVEFLADFLFHETGGFQSFDFAFERFRPAFRFGVALRSYRKYFNVVALAFGTQFSSKRFLDDPVDLEVGISAYGRSEVRVILERQSEMSEGIFAVTGFRKPGKKAFFNWRDARLRLHSQIGFAKFFGREIAVRKVDPVFFKEDSQIGPVFFRGGFVHPVYERDAEFRKRTRYFLVGQNHERFDESVGGLSLAQGNRDRFAVRSEFDVRFGDFKIDASFGIPSHIDDSGEFEGIVHEPEDFSVGEGMSSVPILP